MEQGWQFNEGILYPPPGIAPKGLVAGFTARGFGDMTGAEGKERLVKTMGAETLRTLSQVHSTTILDTCAPHGDHTGDGWAGPLQTGVLYSVRVADCLPLLLWGVEKPVGAAVHAGWRGAVAGIGSAAVARLDEKPENLVAVLGPAIQRCCFEVGEDVLTAAGKLSDRFAPKGGGKYLFDLPGFVEDQLKCLGVRPENIHSARACTRCGRDLFYSYRGGDLSPRMCGFLGVVP